MKGKRAAEGEERDGGRRARRARRCRMVRREHLKDSRVNKNRVLHLLNLLMPLHSL